MGACAVLLVAAACDATPHRVAEAAAPPATLAPEQGGTPAVTFQVAPQGNTARYRIREQLVGFDLPNDAVGETSDVSGSIGIDASGRVVSSASRIVVGVGSLKSDRDRRDGFVRSRVLVADSFPSVELVVTAIRGIQPPVPASGTRTFTVDGNLTVRGVTRPTTWTGEATFANDVITGTAATAFTFAHFGLSQPRVRSVLSVADTIRLEYDFRLQRQARPN